MFNKVIKPMDEMEKDIALKSMRWAFLFTTIALALWGFISISFKTSNDGKIPIYILGIQNLIMFIARQIYRKRVEDNEWKKDTNRFVITFIIVLLVISTISIWFFWLHK